MKEFGQPDSLRLEVQPSPAMEPLGQGGDAGDVYAFPLSLAQHRMWCADRAQPGDPVYNASFRWSLEGALDPKIVEATLNEIVRRHEILRATIRQSDGEPLQFIAPTLRLCVEVTDLRSLRTEERETQIDLLCGEEAKRSFNLEKGPLVRAGLLRNADERHILYLTLHHIVCDGWSVGLIMEEFQNIYRAFVENRASSLPELPIQFGDYVIWQKDGLAGDEMGQQQVYWTKKLAGYRRLEIPGDLTVANRRSTNSAIISTLLPRGLTERLKALGNQLGGTMFTTTLAACLVLLHRYSGENDISVGSPLAGRNRTELENSIGLFVNHIVLRTQVCPDLSFSDFAAKVQETVWEAFANQDVPFENVLSALRSTGDPVPEPFYLVNFICQREYARASTFVFEFAGIRMSTMPSKSQGALYDLNFFLVEREVGWRLSLEYKTDLYTSQTAQQLLGHFKQLLEEIVADPTRTISSYLSSVNHSQPRQNGSIAPEALSESAKTATSGPSSAPEDAPPADEAYALPASLAQERFWLLEKIAPGNPASHMPACVRLVGKLSHTLLEKSFQALVDRHETLRTTFQEINGSLTELVAPARSISLPIISLENVAEPERDKHLADLLRAEAREPFDLSRGPLLRAKLFRLGSEEHVLLTIFHHILADGWSQGVLQRELWTIYEQLTVGKEPSLPPLTIQYGDFAHWQRDWLASAEATEHMDFWIKRLEGRLPVLDFPADRPSRKEPPSEGAIETILLPADLTRSLKVLGQAHDVTAFMVTLACFAALLHRYTGQEDMLVGSPVANRKAETESLIGPFAGPVCLRLDLSGNPTAGELLCRVREVVLDTLSHSDLPFEALVEKLDVRPLNGRSPLFQFYFFYQSAFLKPRELNGLTITPMPTFSPGTAFEMQLGLVERGEGVRAQLEYNPDLFDATTVKGVLGFYQKLLQVFADDPDRRISELPVPQGLKRLPAQPMEWAKREYVAPRNESEKKVAQIFAHLLAVNSVGINGDFFDLGGRSLLAIKALSRIRDVFGKNLTVRDFFSHSTVAGLAGILGNETRAVESIQPIGKRNEKSPCPLSYAQERLWFLDQLAPGRAVYNMVDVIRFSGAFDAGAMKDTLDDLTQRQESLRTSFRKIDGEPVQVIHPEAQLSIPELDLSALPPTKREAAWKVAVEEEAKLPFDLTNAPLLRALLIRMGEEEHHVVITIHHIIADEWSLGVLREELQALYRARQQKSVSLLPDLPIQYGDYACWQREWLQGPIREEQLAYWKKELAGAPAMLELPTDKQRPAVQSSRGATATFELPKQLLEPLRSLSRQEDATMFMTLAAAFMTLLYRYTGQEDILVGTPISGRTRSETEKLIGFFLNMVILRGRITANQSFRSLLRQVRETALSAYVHQDLPFERLVAGLAPERHLSHTPLFQVMFVMHNANESAADADSSVRALRELETGTSKFDLTFSMTEDESGLRGAIEYSTDLFESAAIRRMFGHYQKLLEGIVADADQSVSHLSLLTEGEQRQLLTTWNNSAAEFSEMEHSLPWMIEQQVLRTPHAVAVVFERERLTYRELNERANQLAHHLRKRGVGPNVLVGICMERSIEMLVGLLGILKAGGAYVPLDPSYPKDRLEFMLADSKLKILLTKMPFSQKWEGLAIDRIFIDHEWDAIQKGSKENVVSDLQPQDLAYVIYTSGSTGKPKGVQIQHRSLVNFVCSMKSEPGITSGDTLLAVTTIAFDIAGLELYVPLTVGATVVLVKHESTMDATALIRSLEEHQVTVMQATPITWRLLIESGWKGNGRLKALCGGESLPRDLADELLKRVASLWNLYGPTETTIWSTIERVGAGKEPVLIGRPIANTLVYILDRSEQLVPVGVVGELLIGGIGLAKGYLDRPDLTAERFVPSPFDNQTLLYRTGDLARWRPDGRIECLGRVDNQIKLRGFRIELGEIESVIAEYPCVKQSVVAVREDAPGHKRLVAYYVAVDRATVAVEELRHQLAQKLPTYMVPTAYVPVKTLPLTPNGKIDRRALPRPALENSPQAHALWPRTHTEKLLAGIWKEILGVANVGVDDNFFDLGGHSLTAVRLLTRIEAAFHRELSIASLLEAQTIAQQALLLDDKRDAQSKAANARSTGLRMELPFFFLGGDATFLPLSRRLQTLHEFNSLGLQSSMTQDMKEPYSLELLAAHCVSEICRRHPRGPYILAGWCAHGLLAFEVARQLQSRGQEIALLLMIETVNPVALQKYARWKRSISKVQLKWHLLKFELSYVRQLDRGPATDYLVARLKRNAASLKRSLGRALGFHQPEKDDSEPVSPVNILYSAVLNYHPEPYRGKIVLIRSLQRTFGFGKDLRLGWGNLLGDRLQIREVPGNHYTLYMEPNVDRLALEMGACMKEVEKNIDVRERGAEAIAPSGPVLENIELS